jgi:hypothetical protein
VEFEEAKKTGKLVANMGMNANTSSQWPTCFPQQNSRSNTDPKSTC